MLFTKRLKYLLLAASIGVASQAAIAQNDHLWNILDPTGSFFGLGHQDNNEERVKTPEEILAEDLKIVVPGMRPSLSSEIRAVVNVRQHHFREMEAIYEPMKEMVMGDREYDAALMEDLSHQLKDKSIVIRDIYKINAPGGYTSDSVWRSFRGFERRMEQMDHSVDMLFQRTSFENSNFGEFLAIQSDVLNVGASCRSCHQSYRERK